MVKILAFLSLQLLPLWGIVESLHRYLSSQLKYLITDYGKSMPKCRPCRHIRSLPLKQERLVARVTCLKYCRKKDSPSASTMSNHFFLLSLESQSNCYFTTQILKTTNWKKVNAKFLLQGAHNPFWGEKDHRNGHDTQDNQVIPHIF